MKQWMNTQCTVHIDRYTFWQWICSPHYVIMGGALSNIYTSIWKRKWKYRHSIDTNTHTLCSYKSYFRVSVPSSDRFAFRSSIILGDIEYADFLLLLFRLLSSICSLCSVVNVLKSGIVLISVIAFTVWSSTNLYEGRVMGQLVVFECGGFVSWTWSPSEVLNEVDFGDNDFERRDRRDLTFNSPGSGHEASSDIQNEPKHQYPPPSPQPPELHIAVL